MTAATVRPATRDTATTSTRTRRSTSVSRTGRIAVAITRVSTIVASVKKTVLDAVRQSVDAELLTRYIGTHPMAGREVSGVIAARGDLFRGRPFVIVPHEGTLPEAGLVC